MAENEKLELFKEHVSCCVQCDFSADLIVQLSNCINELKQLGYTEEELNTIAENKLACDGCPFDENHDNRYCENCVRDNLHCEDNYVHEE